MTKKWILLFFSIWAGVFVSSCTHGSKPISGSNGETARKGKEHSVIMLVLGSNDQMTRVARIALACDLLNRKDTHFDKIILSGGCGAHGTDATNCEATEMQHLLESTCGDELSGISIFKEENSHSTVQNYCYSRDLQQNEEKLMQQGDTLYVVSSHYHALSVAACFKNDGMDAHYYYTCGGDLYEGIAPSPATVAASSDPCYQDYTGIAQNGSDPGWCNRRKDSGNPMPPDAFQKQ